MNVGNRTIKLMSDFECTKYLRREKNVIETYDDAFYLFLEIISIMVCIFSFYFFVKKYHHIN